MRKYFPTAVPGLCLVLTLQTSLAQRGGADWLTAGFDAQRSNWVRNDAKISLETLSKPGFDLVWKVKLGGAPRQLNSITPPALLDFYISHRGFRTLGFFGTSSNRVAAVDTDLGRLEWEKQLAPPAADGRKPHLPRRHDFCGLAPGRPRLSPRPDGRPRRRPQRAEGIGRRTVQGCGQP